MAFVEYLRKRGVNADTIKRMENEKVDAEAVSCMSTEELKSYLCHEGDRVAVRAYAERVVNIKDAGGPKTQHYTSACSTKTLLQEPETVQGVTSVGRNEVDDKKASIMRKLAEKMGFSSSQQASDKGATLKSKGTKKSLIKFEKSQKSASAAKHHTKIDVGFSVYDKSQKRFKQIRSNNGGGTRYLELLKPISKQDIIQEAVAAFFPDGTGAQGLSADFVFDLAADVSGTQAFKKSECVDDFINRLKMKKMRCYLLASRQDESSNTSEEEEEDINEVARVGKRKRLHSKALHISSESSGDEHNLPVYDLTGKGEVNATSHHGVSTISLPTTVAGSMTNDTLDAHFYCMETAQSLMFLPGLDTSESTIDLAIPDTTQPSHEANLTSKNDEQIQTQCPTAFNPHTSTEIPAELLEEDLLARMADNFDPEIRFEPSEINDLNDTEPMVVEIQVHRGSVCADLITFFEEHKFQDYQATTFEIKMIKPDGTTEVAEDNGGVMRDALTEFYETFYLQYTTGKTYVVPVLRHDMTKVKWEAVAAVITIGFKQENILPVRLAPPFLQQALFGRSDESQYIDVFLKFIPEMHRDTLKEAMENGISSVDEDEFFEVMDHLKCKKLATDSTLKGILTEIAHKELIQKPLFVADCWSPVLKPLNLTWEQILKLYAKLRPTTRKVLKKLELPQDMSADESCLASFLQEFIQDMDFDLLGRFVRFCTGSDLMVKNTITVRFTASLVRCPTSHTCGCVLEIPKCYSSEPYVTFRSEFTSVLKSNYWQMDIV